MNLADSAYELPPPTEWMGAGLFEGSAQPAGAFNFEEFVRMLRDPATRILPDNMARSEKRATT